MHYSVIAGEGHRLLADGQAVRFAAEHGPKGRRATRVEAAV